MHTFPESVRQYRRDEGLQSVALAGDEIPSDLRGAVFIVGPAGAEGRPSGSDTPFLNGDGCLYRMTFDEDGAHLDWRMLQPPCWWAEKLTRDDPRLAQPFEDRGIARISSEAVGGRNMLNTALQAIRFGAAPERLLVTYESGRPYEVCPSTLRLVTPVGERDKWLPTLFPDAPFAMISATSHPAWDPTRERVYAMNFVRGWHIYAKRLARAFSTGWRPQRGFLRAVSEIRRNATETAAETLTALVTGPAIARAAISRFRRLAGGSLPETDARLVIWDGANEPKTIPVHDAKGKPLEFVESAHQMVVTDQHLLVIDAAFKFEMDLVLPDLSRKLPAWTLRFIRQRLSRRQPSTTRLHIIPLAAIDAAEQTGDAVRASTVELNASVVHCFADRDDRGGTKLVLHVIDNAGADSSEFLLANDLWELRGGSLPPETLGMMPTGTDLDRLARFEIDLEEGRPGRCRKTHELCDPDGTWTIALASGPGIATSDARDRVGDLFFYTHGLMPTALSELVWDLYRGSNRRIMDLREVRRRLEQGGTSATLGHYHGDGSLTIGHTLPKGWLLLSPQWVPSTTEGHPGYVVAAVFGPRADDKEVWIFHAGTLGEPVAKLRARQGVLPWGYIVHSTFMREVHEAPGDYAISPREDLAPWAGTPLVDAVIEAMEDETPLAAAAE